MLESSIRHRQNGKVTNTFILVNQTILQKIQPYLPAFATTAWKALQ